VKETEILVEQQQPPQGVFVCDHAGPVVNTFSLRFATASRSVQQQPPQGVFVYDQAGLLINKFMLVLYHAGLVINK